MDGFVFYIISLLRKLKHYIREDLAINSVLERGVMALAEELLGKLIPKIIVMKDIVAVIKYLAWQRTNQVFPDSAELYTLYSYATLINMSGIIVTICKIAIPY